MNQRCISARRPLHRVHSCLALQMLILLQRMWGGPLLAHYCITYQIIEVVLQSNMRSSPPSSPPPARPYVRLAVSLQFDLYLSIVTAVHCGMKAGANCTRSSPSRVRMTIINFFLFLFPLGAKPSLGCLQERGWCTTIIMASHLVH